MEYINRRGQQYFFFEGRTKTGKPKYFASRKESSDKGTRLDKVPAEYEIVENPSSAVVSIRKAQPTRISDVELKYVETSAAELSGFETIKVERRGDVLTLYTPDRDVGAVESVFSSIFGTAPDEGMGDWTRQNMSYTAMLRLTLIDEDARVFACERFCFMGGIDDWIPISNTGTLHELAQELFPHLSSESFYELM